MSDQVKYVLDESRLPEAWYNIAADLPSPPPPVLHPGTGQPVGPDDLAPLFPMAIIGQEVSTDRLITIPEEVRSVYRQWRPTPLYRARRLEQALETPARIYYKYEGVSPTGSHKPNTAVAQAYYKKQEGVKRLTTETGAGQWGSALAFAGGIFGLEVDVWMVRVSYDQKPYRRGLIEAFGGRVIASPSEETNAGRAILAEHPDSSGSLGIAISEAVEAAAPRDDTKYSLGSVLNHVLMHQTVIGEEAQMQMDEAEDYPDVIIGCTGGGSNFSGLSFPFIGRALREEASIRVIAVEPAACPSLTKGLYAFDFGDTGHLTPLVKMHTLGSTFVPPPFHAGGLRYHGMAPMVSHLHELGLIEARAYTQTEVFAAGVEFARIEGILPAPEANHAVKAAIDEAVRCREEGVSEAILFNLCGHGHFDMQAYIDFAAGKLEDHAYSEEEVALALAGLPAVAALTPCPSDTTTTSPPAGRPRPADSVAARLKTPRFLESATVKLGHAFGERLDRAVRSRHRQRLRHVGWEHALDASELDVRARNVSGARRQPPRPPRRRLGGAARDRGRARARRVVRPSRRLVLLAGAAPLARRRADDRAQPARRARGARRRARALVEGRAGAALQAVAQRRSRDARRARAPHEDRGARRRLHGLRALPPREDDRDRRAGRVRRRHRPHARRRRSRGTRRRTSRGAGSAGTTPPCGSRARRWRTSRSTSACAGTERRASSSRARPFPTRRATSRRRS